jgi:hypothetical protein
VLVFDRLLIIARSPFQEPRQGCFCGAEIDIASMDGHVTPAHMNETADV